MLVEKYSIGELSKLVKISTDALRYYDEIDLVKPYFIETVTRYRFYSKEDVSKILRILELKQYGFPLKTIIDIEKHSEPPLLDIYKLRYNELSEHLKSINMSMDLLLSRIHQLEEGFRMKQNILIVDDAPIMRSMLSDMLVREGYVISGYAENGKEGVVQYGKLIPDLVILDICMPEMDGVEVLRKIKEINPKAKVVMCSAMGQRNNVLSSLCLGASDFIVKPFQSHILLSALKKAISQSIVYNNQSLKKMLDFEDYNANAVLTQEEIGQLIELVVNDSIEIFEE